MLKERRRQLLYLVKPHLPLLLLCCRLLLPLLGSGLLLLVLHHSVGERVGPLPWNPFSGRGEELLENERAAPLAPGEDQMVLNKDPNYPWIRDSLEDHIYYTFYDGSRVFTNQDGISGKTSRRPHHDERLMLTEVLERARRYLDSKYPGRYKKEHCNSTRYRTVPTVGLEVDVTCQNLEGHVDRVSLLQPFRSAQVLYHHSLPSNRSLSIILPLRGRYHTLQVFLENLKNVLKVGALLSVGFTVVYFEDDQQQKVRDLLQEAGEQVPGLQTQFILIEKKYEFSRGLGLQRGVELTRLEGDVLFFCDVDVVFTRDFLTRCLATPVQDHQVYMPMLFSLYNPEFGYPLERKKVPPPLQQMRIGDHHGHWRHWGHGMVCILKSDFLKVGMPGQYAGWGGEDIKFLRAVRAKKYKVIRSLEPGLFHLYHPKSCAKAHQRSGCYSSRADNEASKSALALWYFRHRENVSVYGVLAEGNHLHDPEDDLEYDLERGGRTLGARDDLLVLLVVVLFLLLQILLLFYCYKRNKNMSRPIN